MLQQEIRPSKKQKVYQETPSLHHPHYHALTTVQKHYSDALELVDKQHTAWMKAQCALMETQAENIAGLQVQNELRQQVNQLKTELDALKRQQTTTTTSTSTPYSSEQSLEKRVVSCVHVAMQNIMTATRQQQNRLSAVMNPNNDDNHAESSLAASAVEQLSTQLGAHSVLSSYPSRNSLFSRQTSAAVLLTRKTLV